MLRSVDFLSPTAVNYFSLNEHRSNHELFRHHATSLACDGDGTVYFASYRQHRVYKLRDGVTELLAGSGDRGFADGVGASAMFDCPTGIALCGDGGLAVADLRNHRIRKISPDGKVTTLAGSGGKGFDDGSAATATFTAPIDVSATDGGRLVVADRLCVREITADGFVRTLAGGARSGFKDGPRARARFDCVVAVTVCLDSSVLVVDRLRVRKISAGGAVSTIVGSDVSGHRDGAGCKATFCRPMYISVDAANRAVVCEEGPVFRLVDLDTRRVRTIKIEELPHPYDPRYGDEHFNYLPRPVCIGSAGDLVFGDVNEDCYSINRASGIGLCEGITAMTLSRRWTPTRHCHRGLPKPLRVAVFTVMCLRARSWCEAGSSARPRRGFKALPMLPLEVWHLVLMQLRPFDIGRLDGQGVD